MTEIHALSGAYAVDALDDLERARFEHHLADCGECRAEVHGLREAAAVLTETCAMVPSTLLRERVLTDIATVRRLPPVVEAPIQVVRRAAVTRPRRGPRALLAAAAAVVVVAGGAVVVHPWQDDQRTTQVSAADQVMSASDATTHRLDFARGTATVVRSASLGRSVLSTTGVSNPPTGMAYELWLQGTDGQLHPAGMLYNGQRQTVMLKGDSADAVAAGVTIEPRAGSAHPTSDPIALVGFEKSA